MTAFKNSLLNIRMISDTARTVDGCRTALYGGGYDIVIGLRSCGIDSFCRKDFLSNHISSSRSFSGNSWAALSSDIFRILYGLVCICLSGICGRLFHAVQYLLYRIGRLQVSCLSFIAQSSYEHIKLNDFYYDM